MDLKLWLAIIGGIVGVFGAVVAYTKFLAQSPLEAKVSSLEGEVRRKEQELEAKSEELTSKEAQLAQMRDEYSATLLDFMNYKGGRSGALVKREIENEITLIRNALGATESSILVPFPSSPDFVFLSIYGPAAAKLRKTKLPMDKGIVGRVFKSGLAHNVGDPYADSAFSPVLDRKGTHITTSMLTVPIEFQGNVIGVAQFLNKSDQRPFTDADQTIALRAMQDLASRVSEFRRDPSNFETLGLAPSGDRGQSATVLFCDLTASSSMYDSMDSHEIIDTINEYLERQAEVVLGHGGSIDKYLGDGAMFVFNPRRSADHAAQAVAAAREMQVDFRVLKRSWSELGMPLLGVYNRISVASGPVSLPIMGHPQFQQVTVFGDTVGRAAHLCEAAPRDRNVVVMDEEAAQAGRRLKVSVLDGARAVLPGKRVYEMDPLWDE